MPIPDYDITERDYRFMVWLRQHKGEFHHSELPEAAQPISYALGHRKPPLVAHNSNFRLCLTRHGEAAILYYEQNLEQQRTKDQDTQRSQVDQQSKDVDQQKAHVALVRTLTFLASVITEQFISFLNLPLRAFEYIKALFLH